MACRRHETIERISGLTGGGSDGWDVYRKARALKAAGVDVIELTIGEHDRRTEPEILDAMYASAMGGHTGYAAAAGHRRAARCGRARVSERTGVPTGARQCRHHARRTVGAVCRPCRRLRSRRPRAVHRPLLCHLSRHDPRRRGPLRWRFRRAPSAASSPTRRILPPAADGARSLLINSPNNPTGVVYTRDDAGRHRASVCARPRPLADLGRGLRHPGLGRANTCRPAQLPGMAERTLVVGSLSKSHAMTGSRLGWIVGPRRRPSATLPTSRPTPPTACRASFRTQGFSRCSRGRRSKTDRRAVPPPPPDRSASCWRGAACPSCPRPARCT